MWPLKSIRRGRAAGVATSNWHQTGQPPPAPPLRQPPRRSPNRPAALSPPWRAVGGRLATQLSGRPDNWDMENRSRRRPRWAHRAAAGGAEEERTVARLLV